MNVYYIQIKENLRNKVISYVNELFPIGLLTSQVRFIFLMLKSNTFDRFIHENVSLLPSAILKLKKIHN